MAVQHAISPVLSIQLNEKVIDGALLVHSTVEAHNCVQLRRWLKCHGRPKGENKAELVKRVKNALRNSVPVDPGLDKGKWLKLDVQKQKNPQAAWTNWSLSFPDEWEEFFPSQDLLRESYR